jgi:hypothetical protein
MNQSATDAVQKKKLTTAGLTNMAFAYKQSGTLIAALEIDLFTKIAQGANTVPELAGVLDLPEDPVDKLVTACTALGLLEKREGKYHNSPEVDRYLLRGTPKYYGDFLAHQAKSEYDSWKAVSAALKRSPAPRSRYQNMMKDADFARSLTVAGYNSSIAAGYKLAREFDFSKFSLFLDLGGGSGCYSIPAAEKNPKLRCIVFDFPTVLTVTREFIEKAGLSDRISTRPGDFTIDELPGDADVVGIIGNLHAYTLEETRAIVKRGFDALSPGGCMILIDYMLNDDKTGPLEAAFHHLAAVVTESKGVVKSRAEMCDCLKQAGAVDVAVSGFIPGSMDRVTGKRPV